MMGCSKHSKRYHSDTTTYFIEQYSGGKLILKDTIVVYSDHDPINVISDVHYTKRDTDVRIFQQLIIKSVPDK